MGMLVFYSDLSPTTPNYLITGRCSSRWHFRLLINKKSRTFSDHCPLHSDMQVMLVQVISNMLCMKIYSHFRGRKFRMFIWQVYLLRIPFLAQAFHFIYCVEAREHPGGVMVFLILLNFSLNHQARHLNYTPSG